MTDLEGTPREVYSNPQDQFVADFMGAGNVVKGTVRASTAGTIPVDVGFADLLVNSLTPFKPGQEVLVAIRPEGIELSHDDSFPGGAGIPCSIESEVFLGNLMEYRISVGDHVLRVRTPFDAPTFATGERAYASFPPAACVAFSATDGGGTAS